MRVTRLLAVLAFTVVLAWLDPATAAASCVQTAIAERAALAEVVVYGTVTETRQTFAPASGVIRFQPVRFLKGTLPGEVEVYLGPGRGGAVTSVDYTAVVTGEAHTLYLRSAGSGAWETNACSGSHVGAPTPEETAFFGTGSSAPPAAPKDNTMLVVGVIGIAAIAIAAIVLFLRRSQAGPSTLTTTSP